MIRSLAPALIITLSLAACGPRDNPTPNDAASTGNVAAANEVPMATMAESAAANEAAMNAAAGATSAETAPPAPIVAHGTGRVTAIDVAASTVTIEHGPIPEANWPAMVMAFGTSSPAVLNGIAVGDRVSFDLNVWGGHGEVTAMRKIS